MNTKILCLVILCCAVAFAQNSCTNAFGLAVNDNPAYNTIYYAETCSDKVILRKLSSVNGSVPIDLFSAPVNPSAPASGSDAPDSDPQITRVLAELFNTVYLATSNSGQQQLEAYQPGSQQIQNQGLNGAFRGQMELTRDAVYTCGLYGNTNENSVDVYSKLESSIFFSSHYSAYGPFPNGFVCGPIRKGNANALYITANAPSGGTAFYLGTTTCHGCTLPLVPFFSSVSTVNDFDVSSQYLFFGDKQGLHRINLDGTGMTNIYSALEVAGVTVGTSTNKVYFTDKANVYSINFDGTGLLRLNFPQGSTMAPTQAPTMTATIAPTITPTIAPTKIPTKAPTSTPTKASTMAPTSVPTSSGCDASFASTCASGLHCCNSIKPSGAYVEECYDPATYDCTINDHGMKVLCPSNTASCGPACYRTNQYKCVNGGLAQL